MRVSDPNFSLPDLMIFSSYLHVLSINLAHADSSLLIFIYPLLEAPAHVLKLAESIHMRPEFDHILTVFEAPRTYIQTVYRRGRVTTSICDDEILGIEGRILGLDPGMTKYHLRDDG